jgi:transposase InsO family protein
VSRYRFIAAQRQTYPVVRLCAVLAVSVSGFYAWLKRGASPRSQANAALGERIQVIHAHSRQTYGYQRVHAELRAQGERVGKHRVAGLLGLLGLNPRLLRGGGRTTQADKRQAPAPNVLAQDFNSTRPNEKWLVDMTYVATREGWLYLAGVLDVFSRRIVGWSMSEHLDSTLACDALKMALRQRGRPGLHHSDQGAPYTSRDYLALLGEVTVSMSGVGRCYDNAMQESFWGKLKTECADQTFPSRAAARRALFDYIEIWYNRQRRHSALGYLSPVAFEQLLSP